MDIKRKLQKNKKLRDRGRKVNFEVRDKLVKLLEVSNYRRDHLIEYLHIIQDSQGHINEEFMTALANLLKISQTEVYEVATFYHHFDIIKGDEKIPPSLTVRVCDSVTCEINGANELAQNLDDYFKGTVRIQKVPCIGRCQSAPVAVVKFNPIDNANLKNVKQAVDAKEYKPSIPKYINMEEYVDKGGYKLFNKLKNNEIDSDKVLTELESSNLRGLGGAGFPAGKKWRILKDQPSPRLLAINIDEGEPGTFKDRFYLEMDPHRFFEGMLIASEVVGIDKIYIYLFIYLYFVEHHIGLYSLFTFLIFGCFKLFESLATAAKLALTEEFNTESLLTLKSLLEATLSLHAEGLEFTKACELWTFLRAEVSNMRPKNEKTKEPMAPNTKLMTRSR